MMTDKRLFIDWPMDEQHAKNTKVMINSVLFLLFKFLPHHSDLRSHIFNER